MKKIILTLFVLFVSLPLNAQEDTVADQLAVFEQLKAMTRAAVPSQSIAQINSDLRPHDIIYMPDGEGPFPVMLFFHGCSGRTLSHEQDWAKRLNAEGIAMISVDSYTGRGIDWQDACDFKAMIPWQRASDVIATIDYAKSLDKVDGGQIYLSGFSHGAMTLWASQVYASEMQAPIGLDGWPSDGFEGVKGNFLFYGPCMDPWTSDVPMEMFLGENDAYIEEGTCVNYQNNHPKGAGEFKYTIYPDATHTFDHAKPNQANVDAGSVYDEGATLNSWKRILSRINQKYD